MSPRSGEPIGRIFPCKSSRAECRAADAESALFPSADGIQPGASGQPEGAVQEKPMHISFAGAGDCKGSPMVSEGRRNSSPVWESV